MSEKPNIILVHGAWADGSCWSAVIESLQAAGFTVTTAALETHLLAIEILRLKNWLPQLEAECQEAE